MCDKCKETRCKDNDCGCLDKYSAGCIIYDGEELTCSNIAIGLTLNEMFKEFDSYLCVFKDELRNFITLINLGSGAKVFKENNLLGQKLLRSIVSNNASITIEESENHIEVEVKPSSEVLAGVIELATQAEVDAGTDTEKAVTPSTLNTYVSSPANLPIATETVQGIAEIATQAEVDAGTDDSKFITPAKLKTAVDSATTPTGLPQATETERGVAEIATLAEVTAGTDNERFVTPARLSSFVGTQLGNPSNLPNSTTSQRGVIELATQTEVNTGTDTERAVTPATLSTFVSTALGTVNGVPVGLISMWSGNYNSLPTGWALCDGTGSTPDLRGRFIVGLDISNPDYNSIGDTGGEEEVTLTEAQIPPHSHSVDAWRTDSQSVNDGNGSVVADQQANATVGTTGGGEAHENRPPFYTLAFIMYTG